jgi:transmembrane sensor
LVFAVGAAATFTVTTLSSPAYATAVGERRIIILSDGSRVELNTNSKIIVRYRNRMRRIELVKGEALFNVAQGAEPLLLKAGSAELRADNSQLTVRLREDGAAITVREGRVAGIPVPAPGQPWRQSTAGSIVANEEAFIGSSGVSAHKISTEEIDRLLAWRQGAISLNGESLGQAVEEFNRYNKRQLVIADDSIESLRLGGYFQASDPSGFIAAVTKTFPVSATTKADGSIYLARRG